MVIKSKVVPDMRLPKEGEALYVITEANCHSGKWTAGLSQTRCMTPQQLEAHIDELTKRRDTTYGGLLQGLDLRKNKIRVRKLVAYEETYYDFQ